MTFAQFSFLSTSIKVFQNSSPNPWNVLINFANQINFVIYLELPTINQLEGMYDRDLRRNAMSWGSGKAIKQEKLISITI